MPWVRRGCIKPPRKGGERPQYTPGRRPKAPSLSVPPPVWYLVHLPVLVPEGNQSSCRIESKVVNTGKYWYPIPLSPRPQKSYTDFRRRTRRTHARGAVCAHMLCLSPHVVCNQTSALALQAYIYHIGSQPCFFHLHSPIRRAARAQRLSGSLRASSGLQRPCACCLSADTCSWHRGCPLPILKHPVLMW